MKRSATHHLGKENLVCFASAAHTLQELLNQHSAGTSIFEGILSKPDANAYRLIEEIECRWPDAIGTEDRATKNSERFWRSPFFWGVFSLIKHKTVEITELPLRLDRSGLIQRDKGTHPTCFCQQ